MLVKEKMISIGTHTPSSAMLFRFPPLIISQIEETRAGTEFEPWRTSGYSLTYSSAISRTPVLICEGSEGVVSSSY